MVDLALVRAYANEVVLRRKRLELIDREIGADNAELVRKYLKENGYSVSAKDIAARFAIKEKRLARDRQQAFKEAGIKVYSPSQRTYTATVRALLDSCMRPPIHKASLVAKNVAGEDAPKLLRRKSRKSLKAALRDNAEHPSLKLVAVYVDSSTIEATTFGSVSSCLRGLASLYKLAERLHQLEQANADMKTRLADLIRECSTLRQQLGVSDWKEEAREIMRQEPNLSNRQLAERVGRTEAAIRKYISPTRGAN